MSKNQLVPYTVEAEDVKYKVEELSKFGRLAEIAKAPSKLEPYIDQMVRSFNEEIAKLPPPPPGFFYGLFIKGIRREGGKNIIESEIGLRPIIEPKNEDSDEIQGLDKEI